MFYSCFLGKIFGIQANYYIAEGEFREGEGEDEESEVINVFVSCCFFLKMFLSPFFLIQTYWESQN